MRLWNRPGRGSTIRRLSLPIFIVGLLVFRPLEGVAQQTGTASMRGTVQTPAGVPIPGATVRATHAGTRRSQTVTSDAAGQFEFLRLPPGTDELEASRL